MDASWLRSVTAIAGLLLAFSAGAAPPKTLKVGTLTLTLCNRDYTAYCGAIDRPLDPSGVIKGTISVGFEYYPRTDTRKPRLGVVLPQEGGPGYSSTGTRDYYLELFGDLRDRRDILIVDKRGTGLSDPIDCPALQTGSVALSAVSACAQQLGTKAWFYGTDYAVNDIVAVMDSLDIDDADFYGDSYGTFVGQVMAGLYPGRLRSIVLDSAYPVRPPDPLFGSDWAAAWSGIDLSCGRSPSCSSLGGTATARMRPLIDALRAQSIDGTAPDGNGDPQATTLDVGSLIVLIDYAGYGPPIYRDLDAAARAWASHGDSLPLLRLVAELNTASTDLPEDYSYGLASAVTCSDYPLMYDLYAPRATRNRQYADAVSATRRQRPDLFAPFSVDEGIASQLYITPLDACLPWPMPAKSLSPGAPGAPLPARLHYPAVPTLVLSGDLDSVTSVVDANEVTAQFPNAVHVVVPNLGHVVSDGDGNGCTLAILQRFVRTLSPGDTHCVNKVRPVRTVPLFALQATELAPVTPKAGNQATDAQRRLAASALEAVGDAIARWYVSYNAVESGLRGGKFTYEATDAGYDFVLQNVRFTKDVAVSGTISWDQATNLITAAVTLKTGGSDAGAINIRWNDAQIDAVATLTGSVQGATLNAVRIAP